MKAAGTAGSAALQSGTAGRRRADVVSLSAGMNGQQSTTAPLDMAPCAALSRSACRSAVVNGPTGRNPHVRVLLRTPPGMKTAGTAGSAALQSGTAGRRRADVVSLSAGMNGQQSTAAPLDMAPCAALSRSACRSAVVNGPTGRNPHVRVLLRTPPGMKAAGTAGSAALQSGTAGRRRADVVSLSAGMNGQQSTAAPLDMAPCAALSRSACRSEDRRSQPAAQRMLVAFSQQLLGPCFYSEFDAVRKRRLPRSAGDVRG